MHVGQNKSEGGRMGDHVAKGLSADFQKIGIESWQIQNWNST